MTREGGTALEEAVDNALREVVRRALRMSREDLTAWAVQQWRLFRPIAMLGREELPEPTERSLVPEGMVIPVNDGEMRFPRGSVVGQALWDRVDFGGGGRDDGEKEL